ncbi:MAG: hypothetical protein ACI9VR_004580 [Cognaticolwellia sp.]|jgi:hypothetical protein
MLAYTGWDLFFLTLSGDWNVLSILLLSLPLITGCVPRSERRVEALSEAAETDPNAIDVLVKALRVQDEEVWHLAYGELLALGERAGPALRRSVIKRKPEAGRALLLLGEMGDPAQFDLLEAAEKVPALKAYADQAWVLAEAHLYERILSDPSLALCDSYLERFGQGPGAQRVQDLRFEQEAWIALRELGPKASSAELVAFIKRWRGTEADLQARAWVARKAVAQAGLLIDAGRPDEALARLEEARRWDAEVDTRVAEGRAREALGRDLASAADLDAALEELEAARALGSENGDLLGSLYLERARANFLDGDPTGGMRDLALARARQPSISASAAQIEGMQAKRLLAEVEGGGAGRGLAAQALAQAPGQRAALDPLVLKALANGDTVPLEALARSSSGLDAAGRKANNAVIDQALQNSRAGALVLLGEGTLTPLLEPDAPWSREGRQVRQDALAQVLAYETSVRLAKGEVASGRRILSPLPQDTVLSEVEILGLAERGATPMTRNLAQLHRLQLLRWALESGDMVVEQVRSNPSPLASGLLLEPTLPESMLDWRLLYVRSRRMSRAPFEGQQAVVSARRSGDVMQILVETPQGVSRLSDKGLGALLTVLFALAPVSMQGDLSLQKLEIQAMDPSGNLARMAIDRRSSERMNWGLIASEAPFTGDHIAFIFDAELR